MGHYICAHEQAGCELTDLALVIVCIWGASARNGGGAPGGANRVAPLCCYSCHCRRMSRRGS